MKILRWTLALALASAMVGSHPVTARADETPVTITADDGGSDLERWWGAAGAVLCGGEIYLVRFNPAIGMNPWALGAGIAGCSLALLDAVT
jgi:hypothetical protein